MTVQRFVRAQFSTDTAFRRGSDLGTATAGEVTTIYPQIVSPGALAEDVLHFLNESKITSVFMRDEEAPVNTGVSVGLVHIHDFLRIGLA